MHGQAVQKDVQAVHVHGWALQVHDQYPGGMLTCTQLCSSAYWLGAGDFRG
jgi:hypothetical protein